MFSGAPFLATTRCAFQAGQCQGVYKMPTRGHGWMPSLCTTQQQDLLAWLPGEYRGHCRPQIDQATPSERSSSHFPTLPYLGAVRRACGAVFAWVAHPVATVRAGRLKVGHSLR